MRVTLGKKLFLYTSGTVLLLLLTTFLVLERRQSSQWEDYLKFQNISFARFATPELLKVFRGTFSPGQEAEESLVYDFLGFNGDLVRFTMVSPGGKILYRSPRFPDYIDLDLGGLEEGEAHAQTLAPRITARTLTIPGDGRILEVVNPAFGPTGEHVLSVRFLVSYDLVDQRLAEVRHHFLLIGLVAILASLLLVAMVARRVTRPIKALTDGAKAIARGELSTRIPVVTGDEIGSLSHAFNDMADSLHSGQRQLTEKNLALTGANRELLSMQEQLLRSERLATIGQLAAGVSHEIDNPVGIILGFAELLKDELPPDDPRQSDVLAIIAECKRCRRITGGLLGLARTAPAQKVAVEMNRLLAEIIDSLRPQKLFRQVELKLKPAPENPVVTGDPDRLRQVFINLLLNAGQAIDGDGRVEVALRVEGAGLAIEVADTGPGVDEALRERIFDPFFTTKAKGEGTGLGLAMCRKLIEDHDGTISAESVREGGGRFRVVMPLRK